MKVLITNDDGINAPGLKVLYAFLKKHGLDITVAAPASQCSASAHSLTGDSPLKVEKVNGLFDAPSYRVYGTPADCVRCSLFSLMNEKPDFVFAGINDGFNIGQNILYSATVSAAMEAVTHGVRAASFSIRYKSDPSMPEKHFDRVLEFIMKNPPEKNEMYNVNFPSVPDKEIKGISFDTHPSRHAYTFVNRYDVHDGKGGSMILVPRREKPKETDEDTDLWCVENGKVSISRLKNIIL